MERFGGIQKCRVGAQNHPKNEAGKPICAARDEDFQNATSSKVQVANQQDSTHALSCFSSSSFFVPPKFDISAGSLKLEAGGAIKIKSRSTAVERRDLKQRKKGNQYSIDNRLTEKYEMTREDKQNDAEPGSLSALQPSRGDETKELDTTVGTKISPPPVISKDSDENPKDGLSLRESELQRLEQSAARKKKKQERNTDDDHSSPSKQKLRLAPGTAPESARPGAMRTVGDDKLVDDVSGSEDPDKNPKDNSSALRESKLRRLEQSDARKKTNQETKTENRSAPSNQKLRLAPGSVPGSAATGSLRIGGDDEVVDGISATEDIENKVLEAEVAPNTDELVEMEVERRMQALEENREREQRQNVVVAQAMTEQEHQSDELVGDVEPQRNKPRRKQSIIVGIAVVVIVAIGVGVGLSQSGSTGEAVPTVVSSPKEESTTASPTLTPSMAPTLLRDEVEFILSDYAPLDEPTMSWLTETSRWKPEEGDPNSDYLWLERYALALVYRATRGLFWMNSSDWVTDQPACYWSFQASPQCDGGPITILNLDSIGLFGSLPPIIFQLTALTELSLGGNLLTGTIPSSIDQLSGLVSLALNDNNFRGPIPSTIGNLHKLITLDFSRNVLTGSIPSSIGNLIQLTRLYLFDNGLMGSIPPSIGNLIELIELELGGNGLTGSIPPSIWNLNRVTLLALSDNELSGSIPTSIGDLTQLEVLSLDNNKITGSIPSQIDKLTALEMLLLGFNSFSGSIPVLPGSIDACTLYYNCFSNLTNGQTAGCYLYDNCVR